ncbi:MAG TPA: hypothetical protein ENN81_06130 [Phycisphaerales bacterium]|nr:hypothetical protein [Phycisphaerales bacterium]
MGLGELAGPPSASATVDWKLYYSLPIVTPWAIVFAAVFLVKTNRHPRVLAVLVPLAILFVAWSAFVKSLGWSDIEGRVYTLMFHSMLAGLGVIWLLCGGLSRRGRLGRFFIALVVMVGICAAAMAGQGLGRELSFQLVMLEAALAAALLGSLALARRLCGERRELVRFSLWLGATVLTLCLAAVALFGALLIVVSGVGIDRRIVAQLLQTGLVVAAWMYAADLLLMLFAVRSEFYRGRFLECLGWPAGYDRDG